LYQFLRHVSRLFTEAVRGFIRPWRRLTAVHETAHAVAALAHGIEFNRVTVLGEELGMIVLIEKLLYEQPGFDPTAPESLQAAMDFAVMALAGEIAEAHYSRRSPNFSEGGAVRDHGVVRELARLLFATETGRERFLAEAQGQTIAFVTNPSVWSQIRTVAARVERDGELNGEQVKQIMMQVRDSSAETDRSS
jgi:hypothetical protein